MFAILLSKDKYFIGAYPDYTEEIEFHDDFVLVEEFPEILIDLPVDKFAKYVDGEFTLEQNPYMPIETLDDVKASKLTELQLARDTVIYSEFTSDALGEEKSYLYDKLAAENFRAQGVLLSLDPTMDEVIWFVQTDNMFVSHTREQFIQVIKDGGAHDRNNQMKYFSLEAQVKLATTIEDVKAIAW